MKSFKTFLVESMLAKAAAAAGIVSGSMGLSPQETTTAPTTPPVATAPKKEKVCDLDGMCRLISRYEGQGNEDKIRSAHKDSYGLLTIGRGHLIDTSKVPKEQTLSLFSTLFPEEHKKTPTFGADLMAGTASLTDDQIEKLLRSDVESRLPRLRKHVGEGFDDLPSSLQNELAAEFFRGGLGNAPTASGLIRQGKFGEAADAYLDSREYRKAKLARGDRKEPVGGWNDIAFRYDRVAEELRSHQAELDRKKAEEEAKKKGTVINPPSTPTPPKPTETKPTTSESGDGEFYEVQSGDNLSGIARRNKMDLSQILKLNPQIKNPDRIAPTDRVRIR